jgi:hypothetical protein
MALGVTLKQKQSKQKEPRVGAHEPHANHSAARGVVYFLPYL